MIINIVYIIIAFILFFILYLAGQAINRGVEAKSKNKEETKKIKTQKNNISYELSSLNELYKNKIITEEEFNKAKTKILDK